MIKAVKELENWMNNYPRAILSGISASTARARLTA
jgi:hypothetical protein